MPITLTATDNANGTGATGIVTGSAGGAVSVYVSRLLEVQAGNYWFPTWTLAGSRTGNGAVSIAVANGYYFAYASEGATISLPAYLWATSGLDAVATRFRAAVAARITALNLPGIVAIEQQWTPDESNLQFPCIVLTVENVMETTEAVYSGNRVDRGYPCHVMICDRADRYDQSTLPDYELTRQKIIRAFDRQQLPAPVENVTCKVELDAIINPNLPRFQFMVSEFTIRGVCREFMGMGA